MTIALSMRFTRHSWAMPPIPGLPSGVWSASADDEGDASGGLQTFQHIFRNNSNNLGDTNLYNIEHVMLTSAAAGVTSCRMTINGMDPGTGQLSSPNPVDRVYGFPVTDLELNTGFDRAILASGNSFRPIWVGTYSGPDTDLGDMILATLNPTASNRTIVVVYGYYWAPSAVNAPGGIQRPANGIWGS